MRTAHSNSRLLWGCLPQCMLGYTPLGLGLGLGLDPSGCGPGDPPLDRILDIRFRKYYLALTSLRAVINLLSLVNSGVKYD